MHLHLTVKHLFVKVKLMTSILYLLTYIYFNDDAIGIWRAQIKEFIYVINDQASRTQYLAATN